MKFLKQLFSDMGDWRNWVRLIPFTIFLFILLPAHNTALLPLQLNYGTYGYALIYALIAADFVVITREAKRPIENYLIWGLALFFSAGLGYFQQGWATVLLLFGGRILNAVLWQYLRRFEK